MQLTPSRSTISSQRAILFCAATTKRSHVEKGRAGSGKQFANRSSKQTHAHKSPPSNGTVPRRASTHFFIDRRTSMRDAPSHIQKKGRLVGIWRRLAGVSGESSKGTKQSKTDEEARSDALDNWRRAPSSGSAVVNAGDQRKKREKKPYDYTGQHNIHTFI